MSLILDALKKLNREKSSHRDGTANIAVEILRPDPPRPRKKMLWYFAAISITAVATACITYAVIAGFGIMSKSSPPATVSPPTSQLTATALPPRETVSKSTDEIGRAPAKIQDSAESKKSLIPLRGQQAATALPPRETVSKSTDEIGRAPAKIQDGAESKKSLIPPPGRKAGRDISTKELDVVPETIKKSAGPTPKASISPQPSLKLSGIIWQEEPGERRAMINGRIATEGSIIEGVKVVEIHPTRVRFLHNGRHFEITLGQ